MRTVVALALLLAACGGPGPTSEQPGCHYVECGGELPDGCGVRVDGRWVAHFASGQDAYDFMKRNHLKTCSWEVYP